MGEDGQDALLQRFLSEPEPGVAQDCLERLLSEHVEPLVRDITGYKSRSHRTSGNRHEAQDEEDIRSEVVLQLMARLRDLRSSGAQAPIENFRGYVAATTYNAYHKYVRMKYPARWRLKNRICYLLNHRREFAIRQDEHQEKLCALAAWGKRQADNQAAAGNQEASVDEFIHSPAQGKGIAEMDLAELVKTILESHGHPMQVDEIVGMVGELQGIRGQQPAQEYGEDSEEGTGVSVCDLLPDPAVDIVTKLGERSDLERLWMEICQLPQRQRVALLLNLRDAQNRDALILFTFTGIATLRRIAQALELPLEEFTELWNKLPLEDMAIADLLGITRQQVINLRKSARERLARRLLPPCNRKIGARE